MLDFTNKIDEADSKAWYYGQKYQCNASKMKWNTRDFWVSRGNIINLFIAAESLVNLFQFRRTKSSSVHDNIVKGIQELRALIHYVADNVL